MNRLEQRLIRKVGGFGGSGVDAYVCVPESVDELQEVIRFAGREGRKIALRGAGRSYGDAAMIAEEIVVDCRRLNSLEFDTDSGVAMAACGATIEDLWRKGLPLGWWPPVVPGTMFPSLGGALAMNIHGKNNLRAGTLGEHVVGLEFLDGTGEFQRLGQGDSRMFEIISSAGLLGAITKAELQLKRVPSGDVDVLPVSCRNWEEQFVAFDRYANDADYMVSWIDAHASGAAEGRGLFHAAWHLVDPDPESFACEHQDLPSRILGLFPKAEVWRILRFFQSRRGIKFLNAAKHRSGKMANGKPYRQSLAAFSFLLDYAPGWERSYAPCGFIQYQCFVPKENAKAVFAKLLGLQRDAKRENTLTVMKRHRPDAFLFSHGVDGYSLAMDIAVGGDWLGLRELCWTMNEIVLDSGGRFYFAKDSTLRPSDVERYLGSKGLERYWTAKSELDPDGVFQTSLSKRLELTRGN